MHEYVDIGKSRRENTQSELYVDMQRCGAYVVIRLSKQRVIMEENPAYGEIGLKI